MSISKNETDVLILYALEHQRALVGQSWIDYFLDDLKTCLDEQLTPATYQITPHRKQSLDFSYEEATLMSAKTIVLVISPFYLQTPAYKQELQYILKHIDMLGEKLFLVEWTRINIPANLKYCNHYRLWKLDDKLKPITLNLPLMSDNRQATENETIYWNEIQDLANDLIKKLNLNKTTETQSNAEHPTHTVFLAEVTDDLYETREEIKRFLEQENISVLPKHPYQYYPDEASLEAAIANDLVKCNLYVQLFSKIMPPRPVGVITPLKQFNQARKIFMKQSLLHWRSFPNVFATNELNRAVKELYEETEAGAYACNIEEFKLAILTALRELTQLANRDTVAKINGRSNIFVQASSEDDPFAQALGDYASNRLQWLCSFPLPRDAPNLTPEAITADMKYHLAHCNVVLLIYGKSPYTWVRQQILLFTKTIVEIERDPPMPFVIICETEPIPKDELYLKPPPYVNFINCAGKTVEDVFRLIVRLINTNMDNHMESP